MTISGYDLYLLWKYHPENLPDEIRELFDLIADRMDSIAPTEHSGAEVDGIYIAAQLLRKGEQ